MPEFIFMPLSEVLHVLHFGLDLRNATVLHLAILIADHYSDESQSLHLRA